MVLRSPVRQISRSVDYSVINGKWGDTGLSVVSPFTAQGTNLHIYDLNAVGGFEYAGGFAPAIDDVVTTLYDLEGSADLIATGTPKVAITNGKYEVLMDHADQFSATNVDLSDPAGFSMGVLGRVITRTGTPATTDAIINVSDGVDAIRLEAGNVSTFLANWNNTNVTDLTDGNDIVNVGYQWFWLTNDDVGDAITAYRNALERDTAANTVQFGASCTITVGLNLSMAVQAIAIKQGVLTDNERAALDAVAASEQSGLALIAVPDAFVLADWDLADTTGGGTLTVTINSLPEANNSAITDIDYRVDGGSWVSTGGIVGFDITGLTDDVEVDIELRAVNAAGDGAASDVKAATPTNALVLTSENFTGWQAANVTVAMDETGPDSVANSAATMTMTAGGNYVRLNDVFGSYSFTEGVDYKMRFYAKLGTAATVKCSVRDNTASTLIVDKVDYTSELNSSTYTLVEKTFTFPVGCTSLGVYVLHDTGVTGTMFAYGFDVVAA